MRFLRSVSNVADATTIEVMLLSSHPSQRFLISERDEWTNGNRMEMLQGSSQVAWTKAAEDNIINRAHIYPYRH